MFRRCYSRPFKLVEGPVTFLPLETKRGGPVRYVKDKKTICLTNNQARHIYEKVKMKGIVNVDKIKQEIAAHKLGSDYIEEDKVNPYHEIITNEVEKENIITSQMEH